MIRRTPTACGRLNAFQKVMLQWSSLHPYNATHVYKIAGPLRLDDLAKAVESTFCCHGLGTARLSADGRTFRHETEIQPHVALISCREDPEAHDAGAFGPRLESSVRAADHAPLPVFGDRRRSKGALRGSGLRSLGGRRPRGPAGLAKRLGPVS